MEGRTLHPLPHGRSIASANENLRLNRNSYEAGTAPLTDLLDAHTQLRTARDRIHRGLHQLVQRPDRLSSSHRRVSALPEPFPKISVPLPPYP